MEPPYRWIPGFGPDLAALDRLVQAGPRPPRPFREYTLDGEERGVYTELLEHGIDSVPTPDLMRYFDRVAKLIDFHGHLPEKDHWFHYLFAELIRRIPGIGSGWTEPDPSRAAVLPNRFLLFECRCSLIELLACAYTRFRPVPFPAGSRGVTARAVARYALNLRIEGHTEENRTALKAGLQLHLTQELALGWADQIMALDIFDWEIELRLEEFLRKHFKSGASIRW